MISSMQPLEKPRRGDRLGPTPPGSLSVALAVVLVLGCVALTSDVSSWHGALLRELEEPTVFAPVVVVFAYGLAATFALPVLPIDIASGACFGFWGGVLVAHFAATIASWLGYLLGRHVLRAPTLRWVGDREWFRRLERTAETNGTKVVLLARASPAFSFSLLNLCCGAAGVPIRSYLIGTVVGMLPGTLLYVGAGHLVLEEWRHGLLPGRTELWAATVLLLAAGLWWLRGRRAELSTR